MLTTFIGGGNMAMALIGGLLANGREPGSIRVVDPAEPQRRLLQERFGVTVGATADGLVAGSEAVVLAVKPQQMREAASAIVPQLAGQLVISIAAGIRAADLSRWLGGHRRVVRCMPNTPALIGAGITGMAAMPGLTDADRAAADALLFTVRRLTVDYLRPALLDDLLTVETELVTAHGPRLELRQRLLRGEEAIATAEVLVAAVGGNGRPRRIPAELIARMT